MSVAAEAKKIYETELKETLEAEHMGKFVAIEPQSKQHFIADTSVEASLAARKAYPDRKSFLLRVGRDAAFHIGASSK